MAVFLRRGRAGRRRNDGNRSSSVDPPPRHGSMLSAAIDGSRLGGRNVRCSDHKAKSGQRGEAGSKDDHGGREAGSEGAKRLGELRA